MVLDTLFRQGDERADVGEAEVRRSVLQPSCQTPVDGWDRVIGGQGRISFHRVGKRSKEAGDRLETQVKEKQESTMSLEPCERGLKGHMCCILSECQKEGKSNCKLICLGVHSHQWPLLLGKGESSITRTLQGNLTVSSLSHCNQRCL